MTAMKLDRPLKTNLSPLSTTKVPPIHPSTEDVRNSLPDSIKTITILIPPPARGRRRPCLPLAQTSVRRRPQQFRLHISPINIPLTGAALALCLQQSDCVMIHRNTPADCLRPPLSDTLPTQCQQLKHGYGQCKRGQIDMRKRFRGNKPIATSTELEGGGERKTAGMLYAGKPAFGTEGTDGREMEARGGEGDAEYERFVRNDGIEDIRRKK